MKTKHWTFGDVRVTPVVESITAVPAEAIFPTSSRTGVDKNWDWLHPQYIDDDGNLLLAVQTFLVDSNGTKIVIDTCVGNEPPEAFSAAAVPGSKYLADLGDAGFAPEAVDLVLCTHLHMDHIGWNTTRVGESFIPTFPNARYLFTEPAMAALRQPQPGETASHGTDHAVVPLIEAGLVDVVPMDHRLTEYVRLESTPGHSRGHVSVHIESSGCHALITGDLVHHPVQWAELGWNQISDVDIAASHATRRRILDQYAGTDVTVIGSHFARPAAGTLSKVDGVGRFLPKV